jgi:hypothetical protein
MTLKGASNSGKSKGSGSAKPKASARVTPAKSLADKPAVKSGRNNRTLWIVLILLIVVGLCCVGSIAMGWTYGDGLIDFLRSMDVQ